MNSTQSRLFALGTALGACLVSASCKETVLLVVDIAAVEITGLSGPVGLGAQQQLNARVRDDRGNTLAGRPVTWSSSNNNVASVDQTGRVQCIGAGSVTITVVSEGVNGTIVVDCHNPAPTLSALNPTNVLMLGATFTLTVTGTNFVQGATVRWAGANRTTTFVNGTTVTASIPASDLIVPRYADITVVNPGPGGGASAARPFAVRLNVSGPVLAAGTDHSCALSGFIAYCWGSNRYTQVGDGTTTDRLAPTVLAGGLSLVAISSSNETSCGLDLIGLAYCWGANNNGNRGGGTVNPGATPNAVADAKQYRAISAGSGHTCAIELNGAAWCWGRNFYGQLGDGTTADKNRPSAVLGGLTFVAISAGSEFSCGITVALVAYCWGYNIDGRVGDGTTTHRNQPVAVQTGLTFVSLHSGDSHTCARTSAGAVYCWGRGFSGQLGQGVFNSSNTPVLATGVQATALEMGYDFSCAVNSTTTVSCWGTNDYGQLGIGSLNARNTATQLSGLSGVREIALGYRHACAMTTANEVWCWGSKGYGQLGDGTTAVRTSPTQVSGAGGFSQLQVGAEMGCGLRTNGRISCWGIGSNGQLGNGAFSEVLVPTDVSSANTFNSVTTGYNFACGLVSGTRAANCWGANYTGQLGTGSTNQAAAPVAVSGGHQFVSLNAGHYHACGINSLNQLLCWGQNNTGQLGIGTTTEATLPALVTPPAGVTFNSVSPGYSHTCATTTAGTVYCWGFNNLGQLGDGSTTNRSVPVQVQTLTGIVEVASGVYHSCARNAAGAAWCWGFNGVGELGNGVFGSTTPPVQVTGGLNLRSISAGYQATCAVTTAGQGYCWGTNFHGQGGVGSLAQSYYNAPQQVAQGVNWLTIDTFHFHACGVSSTGLGYCWGFMHGGELGINQTGTETVPKRVQGGQFSVARLFTRRSR